MSNSSRLLARLLFATSGVLACSSSSSGDSTPTTGTGGATPAGTGGADATGGATGGTGGTTSGGTGGTTSGGTGGTTSGGTGGSNGGAPVCMPMETQGSSMRCFAPDGTFTPVVVFMPGATMINGPCPAMVRASDAPCPSADQACVYPGCSVHSEHVAGPATMMGTSCCYTVGQCLGASGCGRPILIEHVARVAGITSRRDWA